MSAAEVLDQETTATKKGAFKPEVELKATTTLEGDKLIVKFDDKAYLEQAEANGLNADDFKKVTKYHSEFMKKVAGVVSNELIAGYDKHKDATGFEAIVTTSIADVEIYGDKEVTHTVKGVEYHGTAITVKQKVHAQGAKTAFNAAKAAVYASFNK